MGTTDIPEKVGSPTAESASDRPSEELVNVSGHRQELERNFGLISICAIAITTGNTWIAQGGSVVRLSRSQRNHQLIECRSLRCQMEDPQVSSTNCTSSKPQTES